MGISEQLDPVWGHEEVIPGYHVEDALSFVIKDSDPLKPDDILGKMVLSHDQFLPDGLAAEMKLEQAGDGCEAFLKFEVVVGEKRDEPVDVAEVTEPAEAVPVE